jgi:hypothetical protein
MDLVYDCALDPSWAESKIRRSRLLIRRLLDERWHWRSAFVGSSAELADHRRIADAHARELEAENKRLRADKRLLVGALRDLRDEQSGPPRPWDQEGWELAMNVSGALLEALEADDE